MGPDPCGHAGRLERSDAFLIAPAQDLAQWILWCGGDRRPATALAVALAACLAATTALYLWRAFNPQLVEFGEGPVLAVAERMRHEPISARWVDEIPYTLSAYGPAYLGCVALASRFTPADASLAAGRLVALLAALATAAVIAVGVRRRTGRTEQGLLGAVAYLVSPAVFYWVPALRVDTLAVLFSCAAYLAIGAGRTSLLISAGLVALGSLAKQTAALSAVPIILHLALNKRYRDACVFVVAVGAIGGLLWWAVDWYSQGYFWAAAVRNNLNRMLVTNGLRSVGSLLLAPITWLCLVIIARQVQQQGAAAALRSLFCLSFAASLVISTLLACREGSHINYFLETCALGSVLIGLFALPPALSETSNRRRGALVFFAVAVVAPGLVALIGWTGAFARISDANRVVVKLILTQVPRDCQLLADGEWIPSVLAAARVPIVNALDTGRACFLIPDRPIEEHRLPDVGRWPTDVLDAMARNYVPVVQRPGLCIYKHHGTDRAQVDRGHRDKQALCPARRTLTPMERLQATPRRGIPSGVPVQRTVPFLTT